MELRAGIIIRNLNHIDGRDATSTIHGLFPCCDYYWVQISNHCQESQPHWRTRRYFRDSCTVSMLRLLLQVSMLRLLLQEIDVMIFRLNLCHRITNQSQHCLWYIKNYYTTEDSTKCLWINPITARDTLKVTTQQRIRQNVHLFITKCCNDYVLKSLLIESCYIYRR